MRGLGTKPLSQSADLTAKGFGGDRADFGQRLGRNVRNEPLRQGGRSARCGCAKLPIGPFRGWDALILGENQ